MRKRLWSIVIALALCLSLLSVTALAASEPENFVFDISEGHVIITDGSTEGTVKVTYGSEQTTTADIDPSQVITVTGSYKGTHNYETDHNLVVKTSTPVTIQASNLTIDNAASQYCYAMALEAANANVTLILEGENTFKGGTDKAGIAVGKDNTLTIQGDGSVMAQGGTGVGGAGIGAGGGGDCGTIIIESGTVTATGRDGGAGIGGGERFAGCGGAGGTIIINGGTVTATGSSGGADIGGGNGTTDNGTLSGAGRAVITATGNTVKANTDSFNGIINGEVYGTVDYGVTVNDEAVTSSNLDDVLGNGTVSYNPDTNVLSASGLNGSTLTISGTGSTDVVITGASGVPAVGALTVTGAKDVTVSTNSGSPTISNPASIACTGNVMIKNEGSGIGVQGTLAVTGAQDVTVTAAGSGQAVSNNTEIACSGDVTLTSDSGMVVSGKLTVTGAKDVTVSANCSNPAITGVVEITCSGNINITNDAGMAMSSTLTVTDAKDVTVTANCSSPAIGGPAKIGCSGNINITNDAGMAMGSMLTVTGAKDVTVTANSGNPGISSPASIACTGNVMIKNEGSGQAVSDNTEIACSGDVTLTSGSGMVVSGKLTVTGAKDVTVTANCSSPAITGAVEITCSGNINITNDAGMAMGSTLTVTNAKDVTVTGGNKSPAIAGNVALTCSGNVKIANEGSSNAVTGKLTVTGAQDVTVTSNGYVPTITGAIELTCSGNVLLINKDTGMVTGATLTVNGAKDVTVTANSDYPAIPGSYGSEFAAKLICSGNVTITNNGNMALGGSLIVNGAKDVAVTGNNNNPVIGGNVALTCSGNVVLTSKGTGMVAPGKVTITGAQNVTVTANSDSTPVFPGPVDLTCSGDVEIVNLGTSSAVNQTLQFRKTDGHGYAVKTGADLDNLAVYAEKAADETFGPETLDAPVVKITTTHSLTKTEAVDPTCTEAGNSAYYTCSVCDKYFSDAEGKTEIEKDSWVISAAGHTLTKTEAKDATCTEAGNSAYYTCSVCDKYFADEEGKTEIEKDSWILDATGHSLTKTEAKDATCTEAGNSAYYTCSVCGKYFSDEEGKTEIAKDSWVLSAAGHTPGAWEHNGTQHWRSCTVCNAELDRANHVFSGATCGVCGYSIVNPFVDVKPDRYYYNAVLWAVNNGITRGTTATTFSPDEPCTRAQTVTFLWRAAGCPAPSGSAMPFTDVVPGSFYEKAVQWAVETGITKGTSATTFSPDMTCSRAQIVTFLWRYQGKPAAGSNNPFTDVAANAYYTNAVLWAVENDITRGTTATTFSPDEPCTRAQNVTFLYRCMK